jgi:sigma-B regulation protein RsbU (phosphoserine phosphatase)
MRSTMNSIKIVEEVDREDDPSASVADQTPQIPNLLDSELQNALDMVVYQGLVPVSTWLALLYAIFSISHLLTLPPDIAIPMSILAGITALIMLAMRIALIRIKLPLNWSHPLGAFLISLTLLNSFIQLALSSDLYQSTNVMLIIIGISFFIIENRWFMLMTAVALIGWGISVLGISFSLLTINYVLGLLTATVLAIVIHIYHFRTLKQLVQANYKERYSITQLEKIIQEMQQNAERLHLNNAAFEAAASGIVITNREGVIIWINPAFTRMTGYTSEEAIGQTTHILSSGKESSATFKVMWKTILAGDVWRGDILNRRKDGTLYTEEQVITPVRNLQGEVTHFIAIKQDVSLQKQTQEDLEMRNRELTEMITIISSITSSLDLDPVLQNIVDAVKRILPQTCGATLQMIIKGGTLTTLAASKGLVQRKKSIVFHPGLGAAGLSIKEQRLINISDITNDSRFIPGKETLPFLSLIAIPIIYNQKVIGVLSAEGIIKNAFSEQEERVLTLLAGYAAAAIQNAQYSEHLEEMVKVRTAELLTAHKKLLLQKQTEQEIKLAVEVQSSLLPDHVPDLPGFEIGATAIPAHSVGGDLYDFIESGQNDVCLVIADIAGKGIPAAMLTSTARSLMRLSAGHGNSPAAALGEVNSLLYDDLTHAGMFITMLGAHLDSLNGNIVYANAGHTEALWWHKANNSCQRMPVTGMPLGITPKLEIFEKVLALRPGDALLLYSDGITEATNPRNKLFGVERLMSIISKHGDNNATELMNTITKAVEAFCRGASPSDDITLIVIKALHRRIPFDYPATLENLEPMLTLIRNNGDAYGSEFAYQIELVASEVITNIIRFAYSQGDGKIRGELMLEGDRMQIDFYDDGLPFDLSSLPDVDLDQTHEGGYGLHIVRQLTNQMIYTPSTPKGNHWQLVKIAEKSKKPD